jgi:regulator of replication initiation timing
VSIFNIWPFSTLVKKRDHVAMLEDLLKSDVMENVFMPLEHENAKDMGGRLNGTAIHIVADALSRHFRQSGAINFIVASFKDPLTGRDFELSMTRLDGESTASQLERLRGEIALLTSENERLRLSEKQLQKG